MKGDITLTLELDDEGIEELRRQGHATVEDVGRVVAEMLVKKLEEEPPVNLAPGCSLTLTYKAYVFGPPRPGQEPDEQVGRLELLLGEDV